MRLMINQLLNFVKSKIYAIWHSGWADNAILLLIIVLIVGILMASGLWDLIREDATGPVYRMEVNGYVCDGTFRNGDYGTKTVHCNDGTSVYSVTNLRVIGRISNKDSASIESK